MALIMSARACQLCGKPLSRIRVGTDGDFCSREHRNQFRLRQGMDRLMEANNVANLMRRREMPKPIIPPPVDSSTTTEQRGHSEGMPMPVRPGIVLRETKIAAAKREPLRLGHSRRAQIALVRFHVLGTGGGRHNTSITLRPSQALFLLPRSRRGGMRASERAAAKARRPALAPRRGEMLRVSGNSGFRLRQVTTRHIKPRISTTPIRPGARKAEVAPANPALEFRTYTEQWSALRTRLYVATQEFSYCQPWSGVRPAFQDVPGSRKAAGEVPPGPTGARVAQVRIELQETMRYAISSEEDRA